MQNSNMKKMSPVISFGITQLMVHGLILSLSGTLAELRVTELMSVSMFVCSMIELFG